MLIWNILEVKILLIYTKTDIKGSNETAWREKEIKKNIFRLANILLVQKFTLHATLVQKELCGQTEPMAVGNL